MAVAAGLCATCRFHRIVETRTGSRFYFCERSRTDPTFPRYPPLPVLACRGYVRAPTEQAGSGAGEDLTGDR